MTHLERNNDAITDYTYDPYQAFRLTRILTTSGQDTLQDLNYTYDPVGNILTIVDNANTDLKKSSTYTYDDLNRLLSATVSYTNHPDKNYTQTFTYDSIGNMTYNSDLGTMNYANGQPHQLSSYGTRNFVYDTAGNMTRNGGITKFTWDWRNRLTNTFDIASENNTYYKYDHNNQRFIKWTEDYVYYPPDPEEPIEDLANRDLPRELSVSEDSLSEETLNLDGTGGYWAWTVVAMDRYVDKYFEKNLNNQTKSHIYLNDIKIATVNNNNDPYYILTDHLNSSSILTDSTGTTAQLTDYQPYGKINYDNEIFDLKDDYKHTGKELDEENDLSYFGARYYDNQIGKFISIDPNSLETDKLVKFINDPQLLNSYSYSKNNLVVFTDPDGRFPFLVILGIVAIGVLLDNIHAAQAPTSANDVNYTPKVKEFADLSVPGYEGLPSGIKFSAGLVVGGLTSKAEQAVGKVFVKGIDRWMAKEAVDTAERASVKALWGNTSFKSTEEAILYHYDKHVVQEGLEKSVYDYTFDARKFWNANSKWINNADSAPSNIKISPDFNLGNGTTGFKIKDYSSGRGGIYTKEGEAVSFFYN